LIDNLHQQGIFYLTQVSDPYTTNIWQQGWKNVETLGLHDPLSEPWNIYIFSLQSSHIRITEEEDELVWKKSPLGNYTPKLGYISLNIDLQQREPTWWWRGLWKIKCPQKEKIFMWCVLNKKSPTWDNMRKRSIEGPGWCALCKEENENNTHLFIHCPFTKQVWQDLSLLLNQRLTWEGPSVETTWQHWTHQKPLRNVKALPFIICWGIWLARNKEIFQDKPSLPELTAAKGLAILSHFPQEKVPPPFRSAPPPPSY
jgi:hypothetical protein